MHFAFTTLGYHPDHTGGAFRFVAEIAEGLAGLGHTVHVIYPDSTAGHQPLELEIRNGVHLHQFSIQRGTFFHDWLDRNNVALERLRIVRPADYPSILVSCHGYFSSAVARSGEPIVSLFTGPWKGSFSKRREGFNRLLRKAESIALKKSRSIFAINRHLQENLQAWHPEVWRPVHLIEPGVKVDFFKPAERPALVRESMGLKVGDFLFLALGRLEPEKGLIELIDSFQSIAHEFPNAKLWIGGSGPLLGALELRARIFGLENRVRLPGFVEEADLPALYSAANCTIDLGRTGLTAVESLSCGTPVVGATVGILDPLEPGLAFRSEDLATKLRSILEGTIELPSAKRCRDYAAARFSWAGPISAFERICLQVPEEPG